MIDKFGSLFAGHIDLDDIGFAATAANDGSIPTKGSPLSSTRPRPCVS